MAAPLLFHHSSSLQHDNGPHPERAERITAILREIDAHGGLGLEQRESPRAARAQIEAVHDPALVLMIERLCASGGGHVDADTAVSTQSFEAAMRASGGAVAMVDALVGGVASAAFSVHRPPGHHAETSRAMGFCLFDHIAVGAQHAISAHGLDRVAIVDFDVHHGNGTQEIFWERPDVQFCSVHQFPFYPGTGEAAAAGGGPGRGYTLNLPVTAGAGDGEFAAMVGERWAAAATDFEPQLILVSAGFDAHAEDPLASCLVTDAGFGALGGTIRRVADEIGAPVGVVLEGGYDVGALARSFVAFTRELTATES